MKAVVVESVEARLSETGKHIPFERIALRNFGVVSEVAFIKIDYRFASLFRGNYIKILEVYTVKASVSSY
jgi:hypothetical protein